MLVSRRGLTTILPVWMVAASHLFGRADAATTSDLAVTCDAAAAPAVSAAGLAFRQRSGVRIRVFPTAPGLILPQIEREIQNDIIFTQLGIIDSAEKENLVQPGGRVGPWRNRLVTAAAREPAGPEGSFAASDRSAASTLDGVTIAHHLPTPPTIVLGVIDTGAVAWMLNNAQARQGLLHQTEVVADDRLRVVASVPDDVWPPILYAASITKLARRGDPGAFLAFLGSQDGHEILRSAGLEALS